MASLPSSTHIVSFAGFTADLRSGELYKNGVKVRLERQPFQVLAILLERPRELVSRDELRNRVWPQDTFVDFDHALNTAITKIRVALGDDADNPRFVETVPRRGYRFMAALEPLVVTPQPAPPKEQIKPPKPRWSKHKATIALTACVLVVGRYIRG